MGPIASLLTTASSDICRLAYVGLDIDSQTHVLRVIEGDITSTTTSLPHWPPELPPIDGFILCYDSSKPESFLPIKGLLSKSNFSLSRVFLTVLQRVAAKWVYQLSFSIVKSILRN